MDFSYLLADVLFTNLVCLHGCFYLHSPWKEAILYVLNRAGANSHYDSVFEKQFVNVNQHMHLPLRDFIEVLAENFTRYQRYVDGEYQIVPREKQKRFLEHIICGDECFHFSEVGSGKTKGKYYRHSLQSSRTLWSLPSLDAFLRKTQ